MSKKNTIIISFLVFLFGFLAGSLAYREYSGQQRIAIPHADMIQKIVGIDKILEEEYVYYDDLNFEKMTEQAITAYTDLKDDPYTSYFSAKANSGFLDMLKGNKEFSGIGAVVSKKDGYILIEQVLKKSPAALAGVLYLDHVLQIDGEPVADMEVDQAVAKMRGEEGTNVKLQIQREKNDETKILDITITRGNIELPSVYTKILTGKDNKQILYIQLILIGEETDVLLKEQLAQLDTDEISGIIIDVRGNGGGYMDKAVDIVSHFVPKGTLVTSAEYKNYPDEKYHTKTEPFFTDKNIIVLIDGMTASAGEIIAIGLQELVGAKLLGSQTFGKGSIQTMYEFKDTSSLKYTVGKWFSPSGIHIDKEGILPDIELEFDVEKYITSQEDNQLQKAIESL